jgi:hypothetical protein
MRASYPEDAAAGRRPASGFGARPGQMAHRRWCDIRHLPISAV